MFFFKKRPFIAKNKLPEKLVKLKHDSMPCWVWDPEYRMIVWSNIEGLKFWNVENKDEIKELIFPETNSMVVICDRNLRKITNKKVINDVITFPTRLMATNYVCQLEYQSLPDGRDGILITVHLSPAKPIKDNDLDKKIPLKSNDIDETLDENSLELDDDNDDDIIDDNAVSINNPAMIDKVSKNHDILLTKPLAFTCNNFGKIISINKIALDMLNVKKGDDFSDIFSLGDVADNIIQRASYDKTISFVRKFDIGFGVFPYLVQTEQVDYDGNLHFNIGILSISEDKYQEFIDSEKKSYPQQNSQVVNLNSAPSKTQEKTQEKQSVSEQKQEEKPTKSYTAQIPWKNSKKPSSESSGFLSSSFIGDITGVGVFDVAEDGTIQMVNQMGSTLIGHKKDSLIGKNIVNLLGSEAKTVLDEMFINKNNAVLNDLQHGVTCQFTDGFNLERVAKLVVRQNDNKNGYWFILSDNTEMEKIKNELSELKVYASETVPAVINKTQRPFTDIMLETKSEIPTFVSAVSHEIRAPLNAIAGYAEMIESEIFGHLPDERYKEYASSIRGAGEYALSIVNELLDYSKLKAGGFTPQFSDVNIDVVATEAISVVYPQAQARKIEIAKTILTGTPHIRSDSRLLKQILINLLTNAIKYSGDNETVLLTAGLTKTGRIMIEITDFGRGMTEEQIHNALTPFSSGSQSDDVAGTGLGLCLSKELAELTQARFMIDSIPGEKTRIRVIYEKTAMIET